MTILLQMPFPGQSLSLSLKLKSVRWASFSLWITSGWHCSGWAIEMFNSEDFQLWRWRGSRRSRACGSLESGWIRCRSAWPLHVFHHWFPYLQGFWMFHFPFDRGLRFPAVGTNNHTGSPTEKWGFEEFWSFTAFCWWAIAARCFKVIHHSEFGLKISWVWSGVKGCSLRKRWDGGVSAIHECERKWACAIVDRSVVGL